MSRPVHRPRRPAPLAFLLGLAAAGLVTGSLLTGSLAAAEPPPPPDPIGLGERLALIDVLQSDYAITVAPGTPVEELRARYAEAWTARHPDPAADAALAERDEAARLRRRIADRFGRTPAADLDLAGLRQLYHELDAVQQVQDEELTRQRLAEPAAEPVAEAPAPVPASRPGMRPATPAPATAARPAAARPRAAAITVKTIPFPAEGVVGAVLIDGPKPALCVQFGQERSIEFHGVFETLYASLLRGKGPTNAVFLLGHGSGVSINGAPISEHLRANRAFYETLGGTRPAARIDCLVIASCSRGSPVQMGAMRDGLGYYPTWRVATADRSYATGQSVVAAFAAIADLPAGETWRGIFRAGREPEVIGSLGEVGLDGAKGSMQYFDLP